jgi:hypothetical protein
MNIKKTITDIINSIKSATEKRYKSAGVFMSETDNTKTGATNESGGYNQSTDPFAKNDTDLFTDRIIVRK